MPKEPDPRIPHCTCGGTLWYRIKTQDYRCSRCPKITPLSELTPMQGPPKPVPAEKPDAVVGLNVPVVNVDGA